MQRDFAPVVYLLASKRNGTLYVGVTSDLLGRIHKHRTGMIAGFTREYGVRMLVWFEQHSTMEHAIIREKRIKKWNRAWKLELIETANLDGDYPLDTCKQNEYILMHEQGTHTTRVPGSVSDRG